MHDDTKAALTAALEAEGATRWPDLEWVVRRGSRIRTLRSVAIAVVTLAVVGAAAGSVTLLSGNGSGIPRPAGPNETNAPDRSALVEEVPEQQQAEIFAFRALGATGVMTPLGERTYTWSSSEHTMRIDGVWRIGFAASDCAPRDGPEGASQTCRSLVGEDEQTGNPRGPDTFVDVSHDGDTWRVVGVLGAMPGDHRDRVIGYELPREDEPSHWEIPAAEIWRMTDEGSVQMWPVWVGPYPTNAPGSVCEIQALDAEGRPVAQPSVFYMEPPNAAHSRMGWVSGRGAGTDEDFDDVEVGCRQYTGLGWEVEHGPDLIANEGRAIGVSAALVWRGDRGFTGAAVCRATLVDEDGVVVWEGSEKKLALWTPRDLKDYPYRAEVLVATDRTVFADAIGAFECETR